MERYLVELGKRGKKGLSAVQTYSEIVDCIQQGKWLSDFIHCKRTKNGESRLQNCIKFDLGHGCRLVTVKDNGHLFILFAGTHEQTDHWIETHRDDCFSNSTSLFLSEIVEQDSRSEVSQLCRSDRNTPSKETDEYEIQLLKKIDESTLRMVFQGLHR